MTVQPNIRIPEEAKPFSISRTEASIQFDNVHFHYIPGKDILHDLSFSVLAGKRVAIVGGSGSGKSTLIRLLYRFFDPSQGSITIAGREISSVDLDSLRKSIAIVPQDSVLFHNTIRHNIAYGRLGCTDNDVIEAAKMAEIHHSILSWPNGYKTQVRKNNIC